MRKSARGAVCCLHLELSKQAHLFWEDFNVRDVFARIKETICAVAHVHGPS